jgi:hypothetical protein
VSIWDAELLPAPLYERFRTAVREELVAHKRSRRLAVGKHWTLVFESEATVAYQLQEVACLAEGCGASASSRVADLDLYRSFQSAPSSVLTATLLFHGRGPEGATELERMDGHLGGLRLRLGGDSVVAYPLGAADLHGAVRFIGFDTGALPAAPDRLRHDLVELRLDDAGARARMPLATRKELADDLEAKCDPLGIARRLHLPRTWAALP